MLNVAHKKLSTISLSLKRKNIEHHEEDLTIWGNWCKKTPFKKSESRYSDIGLDIERIEIK
jgi:hypothetical protein